MSELKKAVLRRLGSLEPIHPAWVLAAAAGVWLLAMGAGKVLEARRVGLVNELVRLEEARSELDAASSELRERRELAAKDLAAFTADIGNLTQSRRALYEGGLQLQEEKRLLEKQLEIMTTYLLVDEGQRRVHVMRGEHSLESFPFGHPTVRSFGSEGKPAPPQSTIVSKERFAHPERGKSEQVGGQLQWEPPQVGSSQRANALGEYVMFTRGPLILHGPPTKAEEHAVFPHQCLGLELPVARKLYQAAYVGTKITVRPPTMEALLKR